MQRKRTSRLLSLMLVVALLIQMLPMQAFAIQNDNAESTEQVESTSPVTIVGEEITLRGEAEKHFRLSDGSYLAVTYGTPVHYQDNAGDWQDIDNRPIMATSVDGVASYQISNADKSTSFSSILTDGTLFSTSAGEYSVSMHLLDTVQAAEQYRTAHMTADSTVSLNMPVSEGEFQVFSRNAVAEVEENVELYTTDEEQTGWKVSDLMPEYLSSSIIYEDVFPDVDLRYEASGYDIKEEIIIYQPQDSYRYDFLLTMDGLTAQLNEDGSVDLLNEDNMVIYEIPAPYMYDGAGEYSDAVEYTLLEVENGAILTVVADGDWINDTSREFPVTIDPTLKLTVYKGNNFEDENMYITYVKESEPTKTAQGESPIYIGYGNLDRELRGYIYLKQLPGLPIGSIITQASLSFCMHSHSGRAIPVGIYALEENTAPASDPGYHDWIRFMNWNTKPAIKDESIIDYVFVSSQTVGKRINWDITELVKTWYYEKTENRTVAMTVNTQENGAGNNGVARFHAYGSNTAPALIVSYRNNLGIEPYYTYTTLGAEAAGAAYIADTTGQIRIVNNLLGYSSSINPYTFGLVYNSDYFASNASADYQPLSELGLKMTVGSGWRLNCVEKIVTENISGTTYLKYYDGDGTIHYFLPYNNAYYDEDGLGLKIVSKGSNSYEMTDDHGNKWSFTNSFLTTISDESGNQIHIKYINGDTGAEKVDCIVQQNKDSGEITIASFGYTDDTLTSVTDAAQNVYSFGYSGNKLVSIAKNDTTIAQYCYSNPDGSENDNRIKQMIDTESGYSLSFRYTNEIITGRIVQFQEQTLNLTETTPTISATGAIVEVEYPNYAQTTYISYGNNRVKDDPDNILADDIITDYLFDYAGRTVNAYTTDASGKILGASNAVYSGSGSTDKTNNRTMRTASIGVASQQLLKNSSFEQSSEWILTGVSIVQAESIDSRYSRTGQSALCLSQGRAEVQVQLVKDETYTFSAYVDTSGITGVTGQGIYLKATCGEEVWTGTPVNYQTSADNKWTRISVTFTAPADGAYTFSICNDGASGSVYVDDVQLETGEAPSNYNLLENGSLSLGDYGWDWGTGAGYVEIQKNNILYQEIQILGSPNNASANASQTVQINLPSTETYVLSGWVTANAVPDTLNTASDPAQDTNKQCGLRAAIHYADDTVEYHYVPFNTDLSDKQFVSYTIVPNPTDENGNPVVKTVSQIVVTCAYETNANVAYFDDISLVREVTQTMEYDEDGNLKSVTTSGLNVDINTYEGGNLIKTVTGSQGVFEYEYHDTYTHRLTSVTNRASEDSQDEWITQSMGYDEFGNVTSTTLSSSGDLTMSTSAQYTNSGNLLSSVTDATGATVTYGYTNAEGNPDLNSVMWGLPTSVTAPNGTETSTAYDLFGRVTQTSVADLATLVYNYEKGNLSSITRTANDKSQTYSFQYDSFGKSTSISVGDRVLATYEYMAGNGLLTKQTYGNGHEVTFTYDDLGRTKTVTHKNGPTLTYTYTGDGQLHSVTETQNGVSTLYLYQYDTLGNLVGSEKRVGGAPVLRTYHNYDSDNRLSAQGWQIGSDTYTETYAYDTWDGNLSSMQSAAGQTLTYGYDSLRRLTTVDTSLYEKAYTYQNLEGNRTTGQVTSVTYDLPTDQTFGYTYDNMGNIATYTDANGTVTYTYDDLGQLEKAAGSTTYEYDYDNAGNMLSGNGHTYTYGDSTWRDLLTAVDGQEITYDAIGNPTSYYNGTQWSFDWAQGRQLASAENDTVHIEYDYDADGLRTSKTVISPLDTTQKNGVFVDSDGETRYYVNGVATYAGLVYWDGYFYYFNSSYKAVRNRNYWPTNTNGLIETGNYYFDDNGRITNPPVVGIDAAGTPKDGLYADEDGELRYYEDGIATYAKLIYVNGHYYYINSSLKAVRDTTYWVSDTNGLMEAGSYTFDAQGRMIDPPEDALTEPVTTFALTGPTMSKTYDYVYAGGKLLRQTLTVTIGDSTTTYSLDFFYDASGVPFAVKYNDEMLYYVTNLQGDVMSIVDAQGTVVASYQYDPYGNIVSQSGYMAEINPLRYRGYLYDSETGLYYVSSRYYDPEIGRFINADDIDYLGADGSPLSYNLFAYCMNNPVNRFDDNGNWSVPNWVKNVAAAAAVVAVVAIVAVATVATAGAGTAAAVIAVGAAKGAAIGMASGAAIGAATGAVSHRVSTGSWNGAGTAALNGMGEGALSGAVTGAITGAASSAFKVGQAARAWDSSSKGGPWTNMSDHYKRHVLLEGKKSMTRDIITYTDDALALWNNSNGVGKLMSSGSLRLKGPGVGGFYSQSGLIRSFFYQ